MQALAKFSVIFFIILFASSKYSQAETPRTYFGTGRADIIDGNVEQAKRTALNLAFQDALEKAVGILVKTDSTTADAQSIKTEIKTQASGYVKNMKS